MIAKNITLPCPDREMWQYGQCTKYYTEQTVQKIIASILKNKLKPETIIEIGCSYSIGTGVGNICFSGEAEFVCAVEAILAEAIK